MSIDSLANLIFSSIYTSVSLPFLKFVNIRKGNVNVLISPFVDDKMILINTIKECLSLVLDDVSITNIIKNIIDVYKTTAFEYTELDDINFYETLNGNMSDLIPDSLTILSDHCVAKIINALKAGKQLSEEEFYMFKVQMFIYASLWLDMDGYLKYLYYLYK